MAIMSTRRLRHEFCIEELKKIGVEVVNIEGIMFYAKYDTDDLNIEYLYHVNPDNTYLLERIKPYLLVLGEYPTEEAVMEIIKVDIEQFKNAKNSKNFPDFVSIDRDLAKIVRYFEDLFLYYNIKKEDLASLKETANKLADSIIHIKNTSERVYHKKDPDSFKD